MQRCNSSGSHFTGAPPLPFSISQNPAKDHALAALPPVAALLYINNRRICHYCSGCKNSSNSKMHVLKFSLYNQLYIKLSLNHGSPFCLRSSQLASHWTLLSLVPPRIRFLQTSLPIFYGQNNANKGIFQDENWLRQQFFDMLLTWEQSYISQVL